MVPTPTAAGLRVYNYIIIGSGTAGSLLASRLSKHSSVLLLESGNFATLPKSTPWLQIPLGYLYNMTNPLTSWNYKTSIKEANGKNREIHYPRGRATGGSSAINGMIYQTGNPGDYDSWLQPNFTARHMKRCFQTLNDLGWPCVPQKLSWSILDTFGQAVTDVFPNVFTSKKLVNSHSEAVGYFQVNQRNGLRVSAYNAFIDDTRLTLDTSDTKVYEFEKGRLEVRTRCLVSKLHFARGYRDSIRKMCDGVMYFREDGAGNVKSEKRVTAFLDLSDRSSSVISCAGAIGSPQILEISGIGDFDRLKKIKGKDHSSPNSFTHHLKGVGENLHDHLQLRSVYKLNDEAVTLNKQVASVLGKIKIGLSYMFNRSGPLSMAPSQMGAFMKSDRRMRYPDMQYHVQPLSLTKFGDPLHSFNGMTAAVCNLQPTSRGSVHITSRDVRVSPTIDCNYLSTPNDQQVAVKGLRMTRRIMESAVFDQYEPTELLPGAELGTFQELADAAKEIGTSIFHPVGTCKMGDAEDPLAVVDGRLRVHGISRLHVCDASVMPSITSGNTNTPTLAVAMRLSEMLEVERKRTRTADILVSVVGQWKCNDLRGKLDKFIASNEAVLILEGLNPKERYIMHDLCTKQGVLSESEAKDGGRMMKLTKAVKKDEGRQLSKQVQVWNGKRFTKVVKKDEGRELSVQDMALIRKGAMTLIVRELDDSVTVEQLRMEFGEAVEAVHLLSRGRALIDFATRQELEQALEASEGATNQRGARTVHEINPIDRRVLLRSKDEKEKEKEKEGRERGGRRRRIGRRGKEGESGGNRK